MEMFIKDLRITFQNFNRNEEKFLDDCVEKGIKGTPGECSSCLIAEWVKDKCKNSGIVWKSIDVANLSFILIAENDIVYKIYHYLDILVLAFDNTDDVVKHPVLRQEIKACEFRKNNEEKFIKVTK